MEKLDQRQIRQAEILDAAKEVFSTMGFHKADINEIAKLAGIAKGTVYLYYPNKKSLFLAVIELGLEKLATEIEKKLLDISDLEDQIKTAIKTYMVFFKNNQKFYRLLVHPDLELMDEVVKKFKDVKLAKLPQMVNIINRGIEQNVLKPIDAESLSYMILGMVDLILFQWLLKPEKDTIEQKILQVYEVLFKGILNE